MRSLGEAPSSTAGSCPRGIEGVVFCPGRCYVVISITVDVVYTSVDSC